MCEYVYLIAEGVHEASQQRVVHGAIQSPLGLGHYAVHVIQEVVHDHACAGSYSEVVPETDTTKF